MPLCGVAQLEDIYWQAKSNVKKMDYFQSWRGVVWLVQLEHVLSHVW